MPCTARQGYEIGHPSTRKENDLKKGLVFVGFFLFAMRTRNDGDSPYGLRW